MSKTQDIQTRLWSDDKFRNLTPHARLLYVWSFTNTHVNPAGLYQIGREAIMSETGLTDEELAVAQQECSDAMFLVFEEEYVWVRARVRNWRSRNGLTAKSIANTVGQLDYKHPLRVGFLFEYEDTPWLADYLEPLLLQEQVDPQFGAACDLLSSLLTGGPLPSRQVKLAAKAAGIPQSVLLKAKVELQVENTSNGEWLWGQRSTDLALQAEPRTPLNGVEGYGTPFNGVQDHSMVLREREGERERSSSLEEPQTSGTSTTSFSREKFSVGRVRKTSGVKAEAARQMIYNQSRDRTEAWRGELTEWMSRVLPELTTDDAFHSMVLYWARTLGFTETGRAVLADRAAFRAAVIRKWPELAGVIDEEGNHAA